VVVTEVVVMMMMLKALVMMVVMMVMVVVVIEVVMMTVTYVGTGDDGDDGGDDDDGDCGDIREFIRQLLKGKLYFESLQSRRTLVKIWIVERERSVLMIAIQLHVYVTKRIVKVIILITSSFRPAAVL
jgi:hypothetical protein